MKRSIILSSFFFLLSSCSSTSVDSDSATGKHSIRCLNYVARCHEKARSICPDGYLVTNRVRPRRLGDDTQYTLNIKCRNPTMY